MGNLDMAAQAVVTEIVKTVQILDFVYWRHSTSRI